jgi:ribosome recycling factor
MSSKRAMRQAQKQAFAKHRSNISNSRLDFKKKILNQEKNSKIHKKDKKNI